MQALDADVVALAARMADAADAGASQPASE